eukprot:m.1239636 g.1239636  ORF g.1239636 m.1239636 type:complete len:121 (+) comp24672_c0_seq63:20-382(+)
MLACIKVSSKYTCIHPPRSIAVSPFVSREAATIVIALGAGAHVKALAGRDSTSASRTLASESSISPDSQLQTTIQEEDWSAAVQRFEQTEGQCSALETSFIEIFDDALESPSKPFRQSTL